MPRSQPLFLRTIFAVFARAATAVAPVVRTAAMPLAVVAAATLLGSAPACTDSSKPDAQHPDDCRPLERLPLPAGAQGVAIDPQVGYAARDLGGGMHWVTNGADQAVFFVATTGVIVVDAPPGLAAGIVAAVRAATALPITHLVYSHSHADHIGGAAQLGQVATIVAQRATAEALATAADPQRPAPTVVFDDAYTLTVGGQTLQLSYSGVNHVPGNIFIYAPAQRALILIDIVWPGWTPFFALGQAANVRGYRAALERALTFDFDVYVGGHVGRYGTKADVQQTKAYIDDLFGEAASALTAVNIQDVAAELGFGNPYALVEEWFHRMSQRCADAVIARWGAVLGGADVWAASHCLVALQSLRID
jgi:glyoxylase-like metal-dependent hydrolase (beta-lactamase superfamily II)